MRIVAIGMLSSAGYSSLSIVKNTDSSLATQQVMVVVTLMDGERWLSQLRIVTMNGERAQID
tara:strand:+ start:387 stop:572 length:186 start_codon:yes stop_codon:yes gene_type:complete